MHFEMPADDRKRMSGFYEKVFGWNTKQLGEEMGSYVLVTTTESDENGFPKEVGRINGGFYPKNMDRPAQYPSIVISVKNIKESMKMIGEAGGRVLGEPIEIPQFGLYVSFMDTEGNRVALLQPLMK